MYGTQIRDLLNEAAQLMDPPLSMRDELYEANRAAFLERKEQLLEHLAMADQIWTGIDLTPAQADGLACVICNADYVTDRGAHRPVGRSRTGSQVFACDGECYELALTHRQWAASAAPHNNRGTDQVRL